MIFIESAGGLEEYVYTGPFDHCQYLSLRSDRPYAKNQRAEADATLLAHTSVDTCIHTHCQHCQPQIQTHI